MKVRTPPGDQRSSKRVRAVVRRGPFGCCPQALDLSMLAALREFVAQATAAFEDYSYARALELNRSFFWSFCGDYIELVKERAHPGSRARSRCLSPDQPWPGHYQCNCACSRHVLPFVTEGSLVVVAGRRRTHRRLASRNCRTRAIGCPGLAGAQGAVRRCARSERQQSVMRAPGARVVKAPQADRCDPLRSPTWRRPAVWATAMRLETASTFEVIARPGRLNRCATFLKPAGYHGAGRPVQCFEGWYVKLVDAQQQARLQSSPGVFWPQSRWPSRGLRAGARQCYWPPVGPAPPMSGVRCAQ